ncbi:MAG: UDP-N-acetylmuramoyl-L-alanyl-D-glutamate--2,6-diaminopimelate ligase [Bacteriovoracia bacterium]
MRSRKQKDLLEVCKTISEKDLCVDSRKTIASCIFFAIPGSKVDSSQYLAQVIQAGVKAIVVQEKAKNLPKADVTYYLVDDVRKALALSACEVFKNPSHQMKVFGVTGTGGKTTTTHLLEGIFICSGLKSGLIGTIETRVATAEKFKAIDFGHKLTTPDAITLQKTFQHFLEQGVSHVAIEVSSHAIHQHRTVGTVFDSVLFTNLSQDHLDYHSSMDDYFHTKAELFLNYQTKNRLICIHDEWGKKLANLCKEKKLDYLTVGLKGSDFDHSQVTASFSGISGKILGKEPIEIKSSLIGDFNIKNIALACAAAYASGLSIPEIEQGIWRAKTPAGRMEKVSDKKNRHVFIDYSHKPAALENALSTLRTLNPKKLVCVFGCGGDRDKTKRPLMGEIAQRLSDHVFVTSDNPRTEDPNEIIKAVLRGMNSSQINVTVESDRKLAIQRAIESLNPGDCLLIAGKGHEDYQIIGTEIIPFNDKLVAEEYLNS